MSFAQRALLTRARALGTKLSRLAVERGADSRDGKLANAAADDIARALREPHRERQKFKLSPALVMGEEAIRVLTNNDEATA
jgi:hypothetical protein